MNLNTLVYKESKMKENSADACIRIVPFSLNIYKHHMQQSSQTHVAPSKWCVISGEAVNV